MPRLVRLSIIALICALAGVSFGLYRTTSALRETQEASVPRSADAGGRLGGQPGATGVPSETVAAAYSEVGQSRRNAIVSAAERAGPATVSITVVKRQVVRRRGLPGAMLEDEFFERFFRGYFPERSYERQYESYGSGVIIDGDGYLLTNDHVVHNAAAVRVMLTDGREFDGRVLGGDPQFDLAVVKIDGDDLPVAPLGNSDGLMIGEWAIAVGNPFGQLLNDRQPTVTAGVVSAVHRDIQAEGQGQGVYKDMIQTDAAINPGNSGGPLVNSRGEVIGINTFIFSSGGGSIGIGFAIPINIAKQIINELIEYGRIRDAWVGIQVQDLTAAIARGLGVEDVRGVLASFVEPESPAARAGIRAGDVIVGVNGDPVDNVRRARRAIFGARVDDVVTLTILRKGERKDFDLKLEEVPR